MEGWVDFDGCDDFDGRADREGTDDLEGANERDGAADPRTTPTSSTSANINGALPTLFANVIR